MHVACSPKAAEHPLFFPEQVRPDLPMRPLPVLIPYSPKGYDMNLTLTDSHLGGVDEDDCWCDVGEQQLDPTQRVYSSTDPPFIATIGCLLPHGELGEIQVRTVSGHVFGFVHPQDSTKQSLDAEKAKVNETTEGIEESEIRTKAAEVASRKYVILSSDEITESLSNDDKEVPEDAGK
ncbi:hypothetical protein CDL15_Pgr024431 [Punica granatum]|uniref:Uncharacterized protein n=1 Tax=Punica granatum TaxID=22663 RepID=A0A218XXG5_PUNGR|nr:hypothetical protein CDL15_Pgr024431 [Punica granatum]